MDDTIDFAEWYPLVAKVVNSRFWLEFQPADGRKSTRSRPLDRADLLQEGSAALLEAIKAYQPGRHGASFKTFAYKVIYDHLVAYVERNISPIKVVRWREVRDKDNQTLRDRYAAAASCLLFSELFLEPNDDDGETTMGVVSMRPVSGNEPQSPADAVEHKDFVERCITKIKAAMSDAEYEMLLARVNGETLASISKRSGMSHETVRTLLATLRIQATAALYPEIMENGGGRAD